MSARIKIVEVYGSELELGDHIVACTIPSISSRAATWNLYIVEKKTNPTEGELAAFKTAYRDRMHVFTVERTEIYEEENEFGVVSP